MSNNQTNTTYIAGLVLPGDQSTGSNYEIDPGDIGKKYPVSNFTLGGIITDVLPLVLYFAVFLCFLMLVWASLRWIFSGGNKEAIAKARSRITWALVGLAVTFVALFLSNFVRDVLKPNSVTPTQIVSPNQVSAPATTGKSSSGSTGASSTTGGSSTGATTGSGTAAGAAGTSSSTSSYPICKGKDIIKCAKGEYPGCTFSYKNNTECSIDCNYYAQNADGMNKCRNNEIPGCKIYKCSYSGDPSDVSEVCGQSVLNQKQVCG